MRRRNRVTLSPAVGMGLALLCLASGPLSEAVGQTPSSTASAPDLAGIPRPVIERLEPAVQSQLHSARRRVEEAASDVPDQGRAETDLGRLCLLYLHYELLDAAEPCLLQMRTLQPDDFQWPYYLAVLYSRNAEIESAKESLETARVLRPMDVPTLLRLGDLHLLSSQLEPAQEAFEVALLQDPQSSAARFGLGRVAIARGSTEQGITHFDVALAGQPAGSVIHHHLGMAYRSIGDLDRAREELQKNNHQTIAFSDPLMRQLETLSVSREEIFVRGVEARRQGRPGEAIEAFRQVLEVEPDDAEARFNLARAQIEIGDLDEAELQLRNALESWPGFFDAHFNLSVLLGRRGEEEEAARHLEEALQIDPGHQPTRLLWARLLGQLGDFSAAAAQFDQLLELSPADPQAHLGRARSLLLAESYPRASTALESSLRSLPDDRALRHLMARFLAACPDPDLRDGPSALLLAQEIVDEQLTLDHAETLAMALAEVGRFEEALQWQRRVLSQEAAVEGTNSATRQGRAELYEQRRPVRAPWRED